RHTRLVSDWSSDVCSSDLLERAVHFEDALVYTEPAEFHYPPRQALGAALLEAGRNAEAETVYWEDLRRNKENGWSLFGLMQALKIGRASCRERVEELGGGG